MAYKHLYICSNYGEYADNLDTKEKTCGWTFSPICSSIFTSYKKAYAYMRRVNRLYGFTRCSVEKLNSEQYQGYWWGIYCSKAEENEKK